MGNNQMYSVGDLVTVNKSNEIGTIVKVDSMNGNNYVVYTVKVGNSERLYTDNFISLYRDKKVISKLNNIDMNDVAYTIDLDDMANNLLKELNLEESTDKEVVLKNICKLVQYFVVRDVNNSIVINTNNIRLTELFKGFSTSNDNNANSYLFSYLLNKIGIDSHCVILKNGEGKFHIANIALIDNLYYYFDLGIEKSIYIDRDDDNFVFCCSGIGSDNYYKFFEPVCLLSLNSEEKEQIPDNISSADIDFQLLDIIMDN